MWMGPVLVVMITEPEHLTEIFTKHNSFEKLNLGVLVEYVAGGLISDQGERWATLWFVFRVLATYLCIVHTGRRVQDPAAIATIHSPSHHYPAVRDGDTNTQEASSLKSQQEEVTRSFGKHRDQHGSEKIKADEKIPFHKLFSFADTTDILLMTAGTIGAIGNGLAMPLMTILFGEVVNYFGTNQNNNKDLVDAVSKVSLKFVYLGLGSFGAAFLQMACWMVTGERQATRIRSLYLKTILRQDIAFFDNETNTGEVVERMSGDTVLMQDAMGEKVGKFLQLVSTFIGGFTIAFIKGWLLTLVMMTTIPLVVISGAAMSLSISKMASRGQIAYAKAANVAEQTIGSIRMVASFTGEKQAITNYNNFLISAYKTGVCEGIASGLGVGIVMLVVFCSYALAAWFGVKMIQEKGYNGGDILNVISAVLTGSMSLGQASPCMSAFAVGQAAAFKMFETIKRTPKIDAYDTKGKVFDDIRGDIELRDVYFSYPARPEEQIFRGFSLDIRHGTSTALVGQSGSGKSTVISLIERFYDPQAGEILIDGINLKEFQLKWIRGKIGLVSQEPVLFSFTIKENIAYGKEGATLEEIRAAAELANAAHFINKLPQGLDTIVGEHGTQLSGGQKQRVAIARAILKDPRILLLDEATSALDAESERIVQEALDKIMVNRTTIIVAHRLTTVRNTDMIAVIHRGNMVQIGSHTELVKDPDGAYAQLIRLQEVNKELEQVAGYQNKIEANPEYLRQSSQEGLMIQSVSQGSSEGNSSCHSSGFPISNREATLKDLEVAQVVEPLPSVPLSRLVALNKPEIPVLLIGVLAATVNGVILPLFGLLISIMIKIFYEPPHEQKKHSVFWAIMFVVLGIVSLLVIPTQDYFFAVAGCKLIKRIRLMCFEKVVHMEVGWFDEPGHSTGAIGARLSADAATIRALVGDALGLLVQNIGSAVAGLVIAFFASWQLAFIILLLLPLIGINGYIEVKFMKGFSANAKMMYEEASQVANDAVGSIRTVASFCSEEKVMELYRMKCEGPTRTGILRGVISGIGFGVSFLLLFCVYAMSFYSGARLVEDGKATFSDVFRVFFALTMAAVGISQYSSFAPDSSKAKSAVASIFAIIDRKSKIDPSDETGETIDDVKGEIQLCHLSFKYPSRPDIQIFRDLCLTIHSGKTVALVGESGSGKSTVIALLQRFYDPESGHITLDGVELRRLKLKWLRKQMGLVSQEPVLFNDTIRTNIAFGKEGNATEAEIIAASELANAHKFISSLSQGYETIVGERGVQLSGGQKQRVAIARAIVKSPKILLLDEATSALDAESERVVQDALDNVVVNRTTVVVAHRLSTIQSADVIAVVKNGVIIEKGSHNILMQIKGGFYASLVALYTSKPST
ncbi:ABC transporter [Trema orientale]|uniref:ABC transporter n=1 Tax=Trema orientale TaxID=63057 RepID=A0A2P5EBZ2_TREOI|nr:ABC transporter [Trema orientale]